MLINQLHEFVVRRFGIRSSAFADRLRCAMLEMVAHQASAHGAKGFLNRGNLDHYIGAVAVRLDHPSKAADLALDAVEAFQVSRFDCGIHSDGFARRK
jgi:hypothetical protein